MLLEEFPDKNIIVDVEFWNYFNRKQQQVDFNYDEFISEFHLHPRVILSPSIISKIDKEDIYKLPKAWYGPRSATLHWLCTKRNKSVTAIGRSSGEEIYLSTSKLMISPRETPNLKIKNCIGVHARLGNGERNKAGEVFRRMKVSQHSFIKEMRKFKNDFYVCSDTKDFIDLCKEEFGDRVKAQEREYPLAGDGPGHLRCMRETPSNPVFLIKEALTDIFLLSKCEYLICNYSAFTALARSTIGDGNIKIVNQ